MLPTLSDDPTHSYLLAEAFLQRLVNSYSDLQVDQDNMPHRTIVPNNFRSHELTMNFSSHELTLPSSSINLDTTLKDPNNSCLHQLAVTNGESNSNNGGQNSVNMILEREPLHIERAVKQYMFDKLVLMMQCRVFRFSVDDTINFRCVKYIYNRWISYKYL